MNEDKDKIKHFETTSFYLAAFLLASKVELINVNCTARDRRCRFIFHDSSRREKISEAFLYAKEESPDVSIDARKFINAIKSLKEKLYEGKS